MEEIKKSIEWLRNRLRNWEYLYYVKAQPEVSDEKYDECMEQLRILERRYPDLITIDSPTQRVGGGVQDIFCSIHHTIPMLSLDNVFNTCSLLSFDQRVRDKSNYSHNEEIIYCCELKIDGVGVNLIYESGILVRAATRGDGVIGEDITKNVRTIRTIPLRIRQDGKIPEFLEIRGEVFMSNRSFLKLNQLLIKRGVKTFSNPRNAASGSLRQINPSVTSQRLLDFFCYHVAYVVYNGREVELFHSHWENLQQCYRWGIPIIRDNTQICVGVNQVLQYIKKIQEIRSNLKFNVDGIVVKVDSIVLQKKLGSSSRAPKWAVSYKFPSKQVIVKIRDVRFYVSRTGVLVPVASLEPVSISGIVIQSATLHNIDFIHRLGLMIGDFVIVERAGDVIPKIISVVLSKRSNHVTSIIYPDYCPVCKTLLHQVRVKNSFFLRCHAGWYCCAQRKGALKHFVSRKAMNIIGIGDKVIDRLMKVNLICTPVDFFKLNIENLISVEGIKERSAQRLLNSINLAKKTTLVRFIYALGIPNVGEVTAGILAETYGDIEHLVDADIISLLSIKDIGFTVANNIFTFFRSEYNLQIVNGLINCKIVIQ